MRQRLLYILVMAALFLGDASPARAQGGVVFSEISVQQNFGETITFSAQINSSDPIETITLFFRDIHRENTHAIRLDADADGRVRYRYAVSGDVARPFAVMQFWYEATLKNGTTQSSTRYSFTYEDNRFPWQVREAENLRVHWYLGDTAFGQAALDAAQAGIARVQELFAAPLDEPIDIYIYASPAELQETLNLGGQSWVGAHASVELGVVMVAVKPGPEQNSAMRQQIPHELAHILLFRKVGAGYRNLPNWLREGLASVSELYPNPDYPQALNAARDKRELLPIADLCNAFPRDASRAFLAYAESASFTRYLLENYGAAGLDALISAAADGVDCEPAVARALDNSLTRLDARWRESVLGENLLGAALRNLAPYLFVLALLLIAPLSEGVAQLKRRKKNAR